LSDVDQAGFSVTGATRIVVGLAPGTLAGDSSNDLLLGTSGADVLIGNGGNDELVAGGGDDVLLGGDGADVLFGATAMTSSMEALPEILSMAVQASTRTRFSGAYGNDWIVDSDGQGTIKVGGLTLTGGKKKSDGFYKDDDTDWTYSLVQRRPDPAEARRRQTRSACATG